ncbi:serine/threonine protein kinase [Baaleninema sp.]|uniref:serine/threonine protein kinase n=1 Tax=Baaleninema sp. TaxID=3101197 RepID=UPI003D0428D2
MSSLHESNDIVADRYRILSVLGSGGMGTTYEAEDTHDGTRIAMKVVSLRRVTDWKVVELFDREARVLANLNHPNIPNYLARFQLDTDGDRRFYLVQELAPGTSLATLIERGWKPTEKEVKRIVRNVLEILQYLHDLHPPVIHRDIKPQNILRDDNGSVYLVDFGAVQDVYRNTLTRGGTFVGTLGYMAHEQFRGEVCAASDLYGLGATALFLLSGKSPDWFPQKRLKLQFRDRIRVSPEFGDWLEKILEPSIEDRFICAEEAIDALDRTEQVSVTLDIETIDFTNSFARRSHQPFGLVSQENSNYLAYVIPASPNLMWVALLYPLSLVFAIIIGIYPITLLTLAIFFGVGAILAVGLGTERWLIIDRERFLFLWRCWGITYYKKYGNTSDIELVEVETLLSSKSKKVAPRKISMLCIWEGVFLRRFAYDFPREDLEIMAQEIREFLGIEPL